jgi:LysM repeat protein
MRQATEAYHDEVIALKTDKDQLTQTNRTLQTQLADAAQAHHPPADAQGTENQIKTELNDLKSSMAMLSAEIERLKQDLPQAVSKTAAKQSAPFTNKPDQFFGNVPRRGAAPESPGTVVDQTSGQSSAIRPVDAPIGLGRTMTITVQRGENLSALSKKYGLTVEQLKAMNGLMNNSIGVGQVLVVPEPPPSLLP